MVTTGSMLARRYLLGQEIGAGGMGAVYEATDLRTGAQVAVKVLHPLFAKNPQYIGRLKREAQIAAAIRTPRVVRVVDLDDHEGTPFLVMEYVAGENLSDKLRREGTLSPYEAISICIEINRALEGAHAVGALHRDLKPSNVKITEENEVKVLDFGIARWEGLPGITGTNAFTGTPEYCAPERMDGEGDIRSDIYSLGVLLYELLSGRLPFTAPTAFAVLRKHESDPVPPLPYEVPAEVQTVLDRCLAKRPEDRFQTPTELMVALRAARDACIAAGGSMGGAPAGAFIPSTVVARPTPPAEESLDTLLASGARTVTRPPGAPPTTEVQPAGRISGRVLALLGTGAVLAIALSVLVTFAVTRGDGPGPTPSPTEARATGIDTATATSTPGPSMTVTPTASATPRPTPTSASILPVGQKITLNIRQEEDLPTTTYNCPGATTKPQLKSVILIKDIERLAADPLRVRISYVRSVPSVPGVTCSRPYDPEYNSTLILLSSVFQTGSQSPQQIVSGTVDGTGLAREGTGNLYGKELEGTWDFKFDEPKQLDNAIQLVFAQYLTEQFVLHRIVVLPR